MHQDGQVQELCRHSDVFRDLSIALDGVRPGHMCPGGPLAQEHEYGPNPRNARCEVDVRIKVVGDPWPSGQVDKRIVQALQPVPQFGAETIKVEVRPKPAANTHPSALSSRPSLSTLWRWP